MNQKPPQSTNEEFIAVYEQAFNAMSLPAFIFTVTQSRYMLASCNTAGCTFCQKTQEELQGLSPQNLFGPEIIPEAPPKQECRTFCYKDNRKHTGIWSPLGNSRYLLQIHLLPPEEIMDLQDAHEHLLTNEAEKEALLNGFSDLIIEFIDPELNVIWTNKAVSGVAGKHLLNRRCYEVLRGRTTPCPDCAALRSLETGTAQESEVQWENGRTFLVRSTPIHAEDGKLRGIVHMGLDISKQKKTEEELLQVINELRAILENSQVGIMYLRGGRVIAKGNQRLADILGYQSPREMEGISIRKLHLSDAHYKGYGTRYYKPLSGGEQIHVEYQLRKKDGSPVWCLLSGKAIDVERPADLNKGVIWIVDDISDQKNLEAELIAAKERAEIANTSKSEFLANMSHEIRTPLNGVLGMLQLIQLSNLTPTQENHIHIALQSGRNLLELINDILDLSKIEAGKLEIVYTPTDLREICSSIVNIFQHEVSKKNLQLVLNITENLPHRVSLDGGRFKQILFNLVGNALKFTEKGSITVTLTYTEKTNGNTLQCCVQDTGIGIAKEAQQHVFTPFVQVDGTYSRKFQGTGLGLSIVSRLISLLKGSLQLESEPDNGTTITFSLPILQSHEAPKEFCEQRCLHSGTNFLNILLTEDDPINRRVLSLMLEELGHSVTAVEDGSLAIEILQNKTFDLIFMDIQMPGIDGVTTTKNIRQGKGGQHHSQIPIIALTAHAMKGDRETFLEAGMDDYLAKPVEMDALQTLLNKYLC